MSKTSKRIRRNKTAPKSPESPETATLTATEVMETESPILKAEPTPAENSTTTASERVLKPADDSTVAETSTAHIMPEPLNTPETPIIPEIVQSPSPSGLIDAMEQVKTDDLLGKDYDDFETDLEEEHGPMVYLEQQKNTIKCTLSESSIVEHFIREVFDGRIAYDETTNTFRCYDSSTGLWSIIPEKSIMKLLKQYGKKKTPRENWDQIKRRLIWQLFEMLKICVDNHNFTKKTNIIHLQNCVLEFIDGKAVPRPFSPDDYSINRIGISYDPAAICPRFMTEVLKRMLGPEDITMLRLAAGQFVFGKNLSQKLLILTGKGGVGKGLLTNVIRGIVGEVNVGQLRTRLLNDPFELGRYAGKTLLIGSDAQSDFLNTVGASVIKSITGGDLLESGLKGKNEIISMSGDFNIIINSNGKLKCNIEEDHDAWERRLMVIYFNCPKPDKVISDFDKILIEEEGPGILNWMISGAEELLQALSSGDGRFPMTTEQQQRVMDMLGYSDSVGGFVDECVIREADASFPSKAARAMYSSLCDEKSWEPVGSTTFYKKLKNTIKTRFDIDQVNSIEHEGKRCRGYRNLKLG